ncbi:hypothetical protein DRE_06410 [Drechslerella stenobrocha 248]|uniref:Uncharacterized protein n=1 Tax=Drechslerella stenobrocha 248 TaxID=1043628 RepID=W7HXC6_9PEZI|nr:hypothetical protein DRE_06410 [Drechslerella stenobrocha 248]
MDVEMDMDLDLDQHTEPQPRIQQLESDPAHIVTPSEQQEWVRTIDAQIEDSQHQLELTTLRVEDVDVIKPARRFIPTKITAYFPSSPALSIPLNLLATPVSTPSSSPALRSQHELPQHPDSASESEEDRQQREILEELARSLSSVSLRTRARTQPGKAKARATVAVKAKAMPVSPPSSPPPPIGIGIGMMMGYKSPKSQSASSSPKLKSRDMEVHMHLAGAASLAPTKITKRGVISGGRGRGVVMRRRNSAGSYRGDTISL